MDSFHRVFEFHEATGATINSGLSNKDDILLRRNLIKEEFEELEEALLKWLQTETHTPEMFIEICDALGDLDYVVAGAAVAFGVPLPEVAREVHRSNMTKLDSDGRPILREDGKVLKGKNYEPPNLQKVLERTGILCDDLGKVHFAEGWNA